MATALVLSGCGGTGQTRTMDDALYTSGRWEHRSVEADGRSYPVGVWIPDGWVGDGRGLVVLHGYGECGSDGRLQLSVGLPPAVQAEPRRWPFVVIAPQKPDGASQWEDHKAAVMAALDEVVADGLVDADRVAITGLSQGGHGTMRIAAMEPDRFAAAAPVCGYIARPPERRTGALWSDRDDPEVREVVRALAGVPLWVFHGGRDDVVPPGESKLLAEMLEAEGGEVRLTIFEGDNHNSWDSAYGDPALAAWLVGHTR